jgi:hypothetical protein
MQDILNHPWECGLLLLLFLGIVLEAGRRISPRFRIADDPNRNEQTKTIRDGLFVLVSLLLGFTLALAGARFAERRSLLVEEAVSVETTYLRASVLPQPYRLRSQNLLRQYVDNRLDISAADLDSTRFADESKLARTIQEALWDDAAKVAETDRTPITALYLNSLNEMIDLHEKRIASFENRVPLPIWLLISSVSAIAVFSRGMTLTARFWPTLLLVPVTIAIVVALIADLDTTTSGLIRLDNRALQRLRNDLQPEPPHHAGSEGSVSAPEIKK